MTILYIYPHPDDESFGPAHVMHKQIRDGHEVYLLTLTKGGATKQRTLKLDCPVIIFYRTRGMVVDTIQIWTYMTGLYRKI